MTDKEREDVSQFPSRLAGFLHLRRTRTRSLSGRWITWCFHPVWRDSSHHQSAERMLQPAEAVSVSIPSSGIPSFPLRVSLLSSWN